MAFYSNPDDEEEDVDDGECPYCGEDDCDCAEPEFWQRIGEHVVTIAFCGWVALACLAVSVVASVSVPAAPHPDGCICMRCGQRERLIARRMGRRRAA